MVKKPRAWGFRLMKPILMPLFCFYYSPKVFGKGNIPSEGAVVVCSNHNIVVAGGEFLLHGDGCGVIVCHNRAGEDAVHNVLRSVDECLGYGNIGCNVSGLFGSFKQPQEALEVA